MTDGFMCEICLGIWPDDWLRSPSDGDLTACPNCLGRTEGAPLFCLAYTKPKNGKPGDDCGNEGKGGLFCRFHLRVKSRGPAPERLRGLIARDNARMVKEDEEREAAGKPERVLLRGKWGEIRNGAWFALKESK